ncbi:MAG: PQQ-binding-like beta-propeller repeat protein [Thermoanaerobaculia bacterium]|nr:PQQ-binding-like beta-propeller repeat protein [Thermoanaerobaculia bacterium]
MMKRLCCWTILTLLTASAVWADEAPNSETLEWNQWRGPDRDGHAPMLQPPDAWPETLHQVWRVEVGDGYSAPVVWQGHAYLLTRRGDAEVAMAIDLETGREVWSASWPTPYKINQYATSHGQWPRATPVVTDGVACFLGVDARLTCHDAATGKLLWTRDESESSGSEGTFCGSSMSPLVSEGLLYAHLGDETGGVLFAADLRSGEVKWSWNGQGPSYSSPLIVEFGDSKQLVTMGSVDLLGFDASSGELLWRRAFPDEWNQNIVTPLVASDRLLFADVENGTLAVRPTLGEAGWQLAELWSDKELTQYMASPVTDGRLVFGFTNRQKGQLFVLDPESGEVTWRDGGRGGRNATLTLAGDWLLVSNDDGRLQVFERSEESGEALRLEAEYELAPSATWAHPAWLEDGLVVKDVEHLARLRFAPETRTGDRPQSE